MQPTLEGSFSADFSNPRPVGRMHDLLRLEPIIRRGQNCIASPQSKRAPQRPAAAGSRAAVSGGTNFRFISRNDELRIDEMIMLMNCSARFQKTSVEICRKSAGFSDKNFSKIRGIIIFNPRISAVFGESATFLAGC